MADVWSVLTPILQPTAIVAGVSIAFKILIKDRIDRAEAEADEFKTLFKASASSHRSTRRELETAELGTPSVPPPPLEENTGTYRLDATQDIAWQRARDLDKESARQQALLERYNRGDPLDTPPEGHRRSHHGKR